jgi:uncharacterized membrane protein
MFLLVDPQLLAATMMKVYTKNEQRSCQICGAARTQSLHPAIIVRPALAQQIQSELGQWDPEGWICDEDLQRYRHKYVEALLQTEKGELTELEREVLESLKEYELLASDLDVEFQSNLTLAQRLADRLAAFGGSWRFIVTFILIMCLWMVFNSFLLAARPFDPYPYILLNLALSGLAALQAPVIMMSQNRQEARDRLRARNDYQINLKAELEIRHLHQKIDHLLTHQWARLLEIQQIQMEIMNELRKKQ